MSLQLAAQHLAAQGRGPDKQLVHMSPREVAGLQALAMSHGGSLSINPKTGLPEAGFLDSILPAVVGAGLAFATGGTSLALTPAMIGLGVGALQTARTGSLEKGLMAGLGAYGGAGLFAGLAGAGAAGAGANSAQEAFRLSEIAAQNAAAAPNIAGAVPQVAVAPELSMGAGATYPPIDPYSQLSARFPALDAQMPLRAGETFISGIGEASPALSSAVGGQGTVLGAPTAVSAPSAVATSVPDAASAATTKGSSTVAQRFAAMPTKDKFKYGLAALSPALLAQPEYKQPELDREQYRYAYTPGPAMPPTRMGDVGEYTYFRPSYTRLAAGGPVEAMSAANVYAMQNARGGVSDMGIDNSTGMQKMADGGTVRLGKILDGLAPETSGYEGYKGYSQPGENQYKYTYDPKTQKYKEIVPSVLPVVAAGLAALNASNYGDGYGGGDMGGAPAGPTGGAYSGVTSASFDAAGMGEGSLASGGGPSGATADAAAASQANAGLDSAVDAGGEAMGMARGGISDLGDYSDGGRLLRGPGDGVSDSIPAMIGRKQPARLADGEFVVPARIVSELGNGSTDAGARKLYAMMDRIQKARGKTVGKGKVAKNSKAEKYLPA